MRRHTIGGKSRGEARNRRRGERARAHLERARRRERAQLRGQRRARRRRRELEPLARGLCLAAAVFSFALSLWLGSLLSDPLLARLDDWSNGAMGRVERIAVQGNRELSCEQVAAASGVEPGSEFSDLDFERIAAKLARDPWIRSATVLALPPDSLLIRVEEREGAAVLGGREGVAWRLVDPTGESFATARPQDIARLPHLRCGAECEAAAAVSQAPERLRRAVALAGWLRELGETHALSGEAARFEILLPGPHSAEGWRLQSTDRAERAFEVVLGTLELEARLERLARLFASKRPELDGALRIDLRFANRAVLRRRSVSG